MAFGQREIEALTLGAPMVEAWSDGELAAAATPALAKVAQSLSLERHVWSETSCSFVPREHIPPQLSDRLGRLRHAIEAHRHIRFVYFDECDAAADRHVRPLALFFLGERWTLGAWCEQRKGFETYAIDPLLRLRVERTSFADEQGRRLADFLRARRSRRT